MTHDKVNHLKSFTDFDVAVSASESENCSIYRFFSSVLDRFTLFEVC